MAQPPTDRRSKLRIGIPTSMSSQYFMRRVSYAAMLFARRQSKEKIPAERTIQAAVVIEEAAGAFA